MPDDPKLQAILHESSAIQEGIDRTYSAIYTSFGVVLPAVIGVFVFLARETKPVDEPILATLFIIVFVLGSLWSQSMWMELLRYVRYKYVVLMPRLYRASSQTGEPNFLEWSGKRSLWSWLPILLFNLGALVVLVGAHVAFVLPGDRWLEAVSLGFILMAVVASVTVLVEARRVEREILGGRPAGSGARPSD